MRDRSRKALSGSRNLSCGGIARSDFASSATAAILLLAGVGPLVGKHSRFPVLQTRRLVHAFLPVGVITKLVIRESHVDQSSAPHAQGIGDERCCDIKHLLQMRKRLSRVV